MTVKTVKNYVFAVFYEVSRAMIGVMQMATSKRIVGINDAGLRVGEDHQNARLTDYEVELMRTMHEQEKVGYRRLATMFEISKRTVARICKYQARNQTATAFRTVGTRATDVPADLREVPGGDTDPLPVVDCVVCRRKRRCA